MKTLLALALIAVALTCHGQDTIVSGRPITTTGTTGTLTVTSTSAVVLTATNSRLDAMFFNTGTNAVYLGRSGTATAGQGIYLPATTGSYTINILNPYKGIVSAVTSSGTSTLIFATGQ